MKKMKKMNKMNKITVLFLSLCILSGLLAPSSVFSWGSHEAYPLLFETFETEDALSAIQLSGPSSNKISMSIQSDESNKSGGFLHVSQTAGNRYTDIKWRASGKIPKGKQITFSYRIRLHSELKEELPLSDCVATIFFGTGIVASAGNRSDVTVGEPFSQNGWNQFNHTDKLSVGKWVTISHSFIWTNSMSIGSGATINDITLGSIALRVAHTYGVSAVVDDKPLEYDIDDFIISYPENAVQPENGDVLARADFDDSSYSAENDGRSEDCSPGYHSQTFTMEQVDPELGYITGKFPVATLPFSPVSGHLYQLSGWFRFDADETAVDFNVTDIVLRTIMLNRDPTDIHFASGINYPSYYSEKMSVGQWNKLEFFFFMDYPMYSSHPNGTLNLRLCPTYSDRNGDTFSADNYTIPGTFSYDNITLTDMGSPVNGDFEWDFHNDIYRNFSTEKSMTPGWGSEGTAYGSVVSEGYNHYLRYTTNIAQYGNMRTSYAFRNQYTYQISFRAKCESIKNGMSKPLTMVLDRFVSQIGENDAYQVPDYEFFVGENMPSESIVLVEEHPWQVTSEWQTFSTTYTADFPIREGLESIAPTVNPRAAGIYFLVDGNSPLGTVLCLDDFKITEIPKQTIFTAGDICFTKNGKELSASYTFLPVSDETENKDATLFRVYVKDDTTETNIGTFSGNETFDIPDYADGRQLYFDVFPVSAEGAFGASQHAIFAYSSHASMTFHNRKIFCRTYAEATDPQNTHAVLAFYDDHGRFLGMESENVSSVSEHPFSVPEHTFRMKMIIVSKTTFQPIWEATEMVLSK